MFKECRSMAKTNSEIVQKCLKENYKQLRVNVKSEKLEVWKEYAAFKGTSLYTLVNQFFEEAIEKDGFISESQKSED